MSITREQVADLQPGDVVEVRDDRWPEGTALTGPVWDDTYGRAVGWFYLRKDANEHHTLTVVSRAPRPLYVNHPRTEPVAGDIARDRDGDAWRRTGRDKWYMAGGSHGVDSIEDFKPLTLLWDGQTKQVVQ